MYMFDVAIKKGAHDLQTSKAIKACTTAVSIFMQYKVHTNDVVYELYAYIKANCGPPFLLIFFLLKPALQVCFRGAYTPAP